MSLCNGIGQEAQKKNEKAAPLDGGPLSFDGAIWFHFLNVKTIILFYINPKTH